MARLAVILTFAFVLFGTLFYVWRSAEDLEAQRCEDVVLHDNISVRQSGDVSLVVALREIKEGSVISPKAVGKRLMPNGFPAEAHLLTEDRFVVWRTATNTIKKGQVITFEDVGLRAVTYIETVKTIPQGSVIKPDDLNQFRFLEPVNARWELALSNPSLAVGKKAKFGLRRGTYVRADMLEP